MISPTKNGYIVESLLDQKRTAVKVDRSLSLLSDIAVFTLDEEIPLSEVFFKIYDKEKGQNTSVNSNASKEDLEAYFFSVLPNFDEDRVYASDIKKIIFWYNTLIKNGFEFHPKQGDDSSH